MRPSLWLASLLVGLAVGSAAQAQTFARSNSPSYTTVAGSGSSGTSNMVNGSSRIRDFFNRLSGTTFAPTAISGRAHASPMPDAAPVMAATLPFID